MDLNPLLRSAAKQACVQLMNQIKGAKAVVISTEDGFEVASQVENNAQVARLSAMASSLAALGVLAGEESGLGNCSSVMMEADSGYLAILQVRRPDASLIISVVTGSDAVAGQVVYFSKQVGRTLEQIGP
jgi:predicted regulator of Ras-like GTPase activity (Roadblock/LC7/MglB family)